MVSVKINGQEYDLLFNGAAMFTMQDAFGTDNINELIDEGGALGFQRACKIAVILAEQGELLRRFMGYDPRPMLTEEETRLSVTPISIIMLKTALSKALYDGYSRNTKDENDEIDLGLAELNKKKVVR